MTKLTRKKKFFLNSITGFFKQTITTIIGFVLPRYMLLYFGSNTNGLISSISHFLGFISLLDMGVGSVIQANLYEPLANNNSERISKIVAASDRFFRRLAYIFLVYIIILAVVFPIKTSGYGFWFTCTLVLILSLNAVVGYFFGVTSSILLSADQRAYIQNLMHIGAIIINAVVCIVLMNMGASIHIVKFASVVVFAIKPFLIRAYVKRHYDINRHILLTDEPIRQKWNAFSQHIAAVICNNIDVVLLTWFSTFENVSVYSVYYAVTNGVTQIILIAATGIESMFGNMIAKKEKDRLLKTFVSVEWVTHTAVTALFSIMAITIVPFIRVYTQNINDANYLLPQFGLVLSLAYGFLALRIPYFRIIKAAGHFKETQNGAYISALLNIVISVVLIFKLDLVGVAIGTLVAMAYHTFYLAWYLRHNIINRSFWCFVSYLLTDSIVGVSMYFISKLIYMTEVSYLSWFIYAVKVGIIACFVSILVNIIFHMNNLTVKSYPYNRNRPM